MAPGDTTVRKNPIFVDMRLNFPFVVVKPHGTGKKAKFDQLSESLSP